MSEPRRLPTTEELRAVMAGWLAQHPALPSSPERVAEELAELTGRARAIVRDARAPDAMRAWAEGHIARSGEDASTNAITSTGTPHHTARRTRDED